MPIDGRIAAAGNSVVPLDIAGIERSRALQQEAQAREAERIRQAQIDQQQAREQAEWKAALTGALVQGEDGAWTYDQSKLGPALKANPDGTMKVLSAVDGYTKAVHAAQVAAITDSARRVRSLQNDPAVMKAEMLRLAKNHVLSQEEADTYIQQGTTPEAVGRITGALTGEKPGEGQVTLNQGDIRIDPTGKVIASNPKSPDEPSSVKEWKANNADRATRGEKPLTYDEYQTQDANRRKSIVNVNTGGQASDVADAIAAMKAGTAPPLLPGRASKEYVSMIAEAKRQGFDLATAATDWVATQKHIATLNGAQQTRINQAIGQLPELLDRVDTLASQWKGGKFPILNKVNLAAAKGGAYGQDVASVATQLDALIADVTADLGAVYMGGNSPTDHALSLAGKALSAEWSEKVLHDMVALARKNVQTRQNSIRNTGVQGIDQSTNPYGPQAPPRPAGVPPSAVWVVDPSHVGGGYWKAGG